MTARIYQRPKNAMQSGKALTDEWILEFEQSEARRADPLIDQGVTDDRPAAALRAQPVGVGHGGRRGERIGSHGGNRTAES